MEPFYEISWFSDYCVHGRGGCNRDPYSEFTPGKACTPEYSAQGPTVERLERLSHLVTTRVCVADVLVGEAEGCRGAWLIRGDALLGINLAQVRIIERDDRAKRATLRLPLPEILQSRVDHEKTRTWEVSKTTWIPWKGDKDKLRDTVMGEAQKLVAHAAGSRENIGQAKALAEAIIRGFYEEVGWQVRVTWETDSTKPPMKSE